MKIKNILANFLDPKTLIIFYLILVSLIANVFFYKTLSVNAVGFGDSYSRMNISRRVTDSLTPGIAQLGGIWLPFPQLLTAPFTAIDILYFNGIAGAFISSPAFILGGVFLFKLLYRLFKKEGISFIGTMLYANNLNLLYIQTTSMSESLFICCVIGAAYYFIKWQKNIRQNLSSLIISALWTFIATLTRYEGFLLFGTMLVSTFIVAFIKSRKYKISEGLVLLFSTLAGFGILLWVLYSWTIFGDPLNWLKIYTGKIAVISTVSQKPSETWGITDNRSNFSESVKSVIESSLEMNGFLYFLPLVLSPVIFFYFSKSLKSDKNSLAVILSLFITLAPALFLILSSFKGTAIIRYPEINWQTLSNNSFHYAYEYNIRYGLLALPFLIILFAILFSGHKYLLILFSFIAAVQIVLQFADRPVAFFSFPKRYLYIKGQTDTSLIDWFHKHYDGGLILASAIANDQLMFSLKIPYKNYIYEGTNLYWKESVVNPTKYARWIMFQNGPKVTNTGGSSDFVSYYLQDTDVLNSNYDLIYKDKDIVFYKIKEETVDSGNNI